MKYRRMTQEDAVFLTELFSIDEYELYFAENETDADEWRKRIIFFDSKESLIILDDCSMPVGWLMYDISNRAACIDIIVLMDKERRKGYGSEVIRDMIAKHKDNIDTITLDVQKRNVDACVFYKRLGFEIVGEENQPVGSGVEEYYNLRYKIS